LRAGSFIRLSLFASSGYNISSSPRLYSETDTSFAVETVLNSCIYLVTYSPGEATALRPSTCRRALGTFTRRSSRDSETRRTWTCSIFPFPDNVINVICCLCPHMSYLLTSIMPRHWSLCAKYFSKMHLSLSLSLSRKYANIRELS